MNTTFDIIYNRILALIEQNLLAQQKDPSQYMPLFEGSSLISIDNTSAIILTSSFVNKCALNSNEYQQLISSAFKEFLNEDVVVKVELETDYQKSITEELITNDLSDHLLEGFTFDNFVVGPSNREAKAAALAASIELGRKEYNPLIIYGDSGLGKTHLINAMGSYVKEHDPDKKILYISSIDFVNEVVKSIKDNTIEEYKNQLNSLDLLLVDDIQSLSGKTKSNEVFFSIYNELFNNRKQIVLTCDRPPVEIKDIEERLKTRFCQGLSVTISSLEFETACEILQLKIKTHNIEKNSIDNDVVAYLAKNFCSDVRSLEGALNRLLFYSINFNKSNNINLNIALEAFKDQPTTSNHSKDKLEVKDVISVVCNYYNLTKNQLLGKNRTKNVATARHIAMYLCRKHLDVSYLKIGEAFGGKDHSTVLSACEKIESLVKSDSIYQKIINDIETSLLK